MPALGDLKKKDMILCRIITVFTKVIHLNLHLPPTRSVHGVCICSDSAVCIHSQPFGPGKKQVCSSNHMTAQRGVRSGLYMTHSYMAVFIMDIVKKKLQVCVWLTEDGAELHTQSKSVQQTGWSSHFSCIRTKKSEGLCGGGGVLVFCSGIHSLFSPSMHPLFIHPIARSTTRALSR